MDIPKFEGISLNFLKVFLDWLSVKKSPIANRGNPDLNPIDTKAIKIEVNLEEEAEKLGRAGLPRSDANTFTGVEGKIIQIVDKARQDYVAWGSDRLRVLNQDISDLDITPLARHLTEADKRYENEANAKLSSCNSVLTNLLASRTGISTEFNKFKSANGLERDAHYPSSAKKFYLWSLLFLMIIVEGAANAAFFSQGISGGLVQGFFYAALFSFINVTVGALFGRKLIPNKNHISSFRKIVGYISVLIALSLACLVGLLIAHFRDALSHGLINPPHAAIETLRNAPFDLSDVFSWLLFLVSNIFAIFAILDGYFMDDVYPGYGDITRRFHEARDDYDEEMAEVRAELESLKESTLVGVEKSSKEIQIKLSRLNEAIQHKESTGKRLELAFKDAENCAFTLIKTFQDINQIHRGDVANPTYYGHHPELKPLESLSFLIDADRIKYEKYLDLAKNVDEQKQQIIRAIVASFNKSHDSLQLLESHPFPNSNGHAQ